MNKTGEVKLNFSEIRPTAMNHLTSLLVLFQKNSVAAQLAVFNIVSGQPYSACLPWSRWVMKIKDMISVFMY